MVASNGNFVGPAQTPPEYHPDAGVLIGEGGGNGGYWPQSGGADGPQWHAPPAQTPKPRTEPVPLSAPITGSETAGTALLSRYPIGLRARCLICYNTSNHTLSVGGQRGFIPPQSFAFVMPLKPELETIDVAVYVARAGAGDLVIWATEEELTQTALNISAATFTGGAATPQNTATGQTAQSTAAAQLGATHATRANMLIKNIDSTNTIYVGFSNAVTSGNGFPLKPGESATFTGPQIWTIAGASTPTAAFFDSWF